MRDDCLTRLDVNNAALVLDAEHAPEHHGEFIEFRGLAGLDPTARAAHVGDAELAVLRIDPANVLVDQLGSIASGFDPGRLGYPG
jgi:hypothetical protein